MNGPDCVGVCRAPDHRTLVAGANTYPRRPIALLNHSLTAREANWLTAAKNRRTLVTSTSAAQARPSLGFRGRSFMAYALTPRPPIADWLAELDKWARNSPGFFMGRP